MATTKALSVLSVLVALVSIPFWSPATVPIVLVNISILIAIWARILQAEHRK